MDTFLTGASVKELPSFLAVVDLSFFNSALLLLKRPAKTCTVEMHRKGFKGVL